MGSEYDSEAAVSRIIRDCESYDGTAGVVFRVYNEILLAHEAGVRSRDAATAMLRAAAEEVRTHIEQNGECELCGADPALAEDGKVHHDGTVCEALAVALDAKETNHVR